MNRKHQRKLCFKGYFWFSIGKELAHFLLVWQSQQQQQVKIFSITVQTYKFYGRQNRTYENKRLKIVINTKVYAWSWKSSKQILVCISSTYKMKQSDSSFAPAAIVWLGNDLQETHKQKVEVISFSPTGMLTGVRGGGVMTTVQHNESLAPKDWKKL